MNIRAQTLRTIFAVSVLLTTFWVVGFVGEFIAGRDPPISALIVAAAVMAGVISSVAFSGGRLELPKQLKFAEVARIFVPRMVGGYIVSVPIVGCVAWALVRTFSSYDPENGIFVGLMAFWLPLWFAPAVGAEWTWRSLRKRGVA